MLIPSSVMAWFRICSILRDGLCDLRGDKSFSFWERPPSQALVFPKVYVWDRFCKGFRKRLSPFFARLSRCFIVLVRQSLWGEGCNIVRKRLSSSLQSCSEDFGNMYFVLPKVFWLRLLFLVDSPLSCLVCALICSRRFLGFDSCFELTAPWLFLVYRIHFNL